jgi:hypothetical protein
VKIGYASAGTRNNKTKQQKMRKMCPCGTRNTPLFWADIRKEFFSSFEGNFHPRRYSTLLDATRRYSTLLDATRRYSTLC